MTDTDFDHALVNAAFALGAEQGWRHVSPAAAARHAGLELAKAQAFFPCTGSILRKFGRMADAAALTGVLSDGSARDKLFDMLMRRFDYLQAQRAGVLALLKALPACPPLALRLAALNLVSMGWLLEGAGVDSTGLRGGLKARGLLAVWAYGVQAWVRDDSADLTATMAALDKALGQAEMLVTRLAPNKPATKTNTASQEIPPQID